MTQQPVASNTVRMNRTTMGPGWRTQLAPSLSLKTLKKCGDSWLVDYRQYLAANAADAEPKLRASTSCHIVSAAVSLNDRAAQVRALKMMVVADMSLPEISERLGLAPEIITAWEALFYDVRDVREATSWIVQYVIEAERDRGETELAARLKTAYSLGARAVRAFLDCDRAIPLDVADELLVQKLHLQAKLKMALAVPADTPQQRLRFLKCAAEMAAATDKIALETKKLDERCQRAREQYRLAKLRCELAIKRNERAAAEDARRDERRRAQTAAKERGLILARQLRESQAESERSARAVRAAASPLAQLNWNTSPCSQADLDLAAAMIVPFRVEPPLPQLSDRPDEAVKNVGDQEPAGEPSDLHAPKTHEKSA